jgi:hypothetical protein
MSVSPHSYGADELPEIAGGLACKYANKIEASYEASNAEVVMLLTDFARELLRGYRPANRAESAKQVAYPPAPTEPPGANSPPATTGESPDDWYVRERDAFRVWWEAGGRETYSETSTMAAGAGWLARAERHSTPATEENR